MGLTKEIIMEMFNQAMIAGGLVQGPGNPVHAVMMNSKFVFLEFRSEIEATNVLQLNGLDMGGQSLTISRCKGYIPPGGAMGGGMGAGMGGGMGGGMGMPGMMGMAGMMGGMPGMGGMMGMGGMGMPQANNMGMGMGNMGMGMGNMPQPGVAAQAPIPGPITRIIELANMTSVEELRNDEDYAGSADQRISGGWRSHGGAVARHEHCEETATGPGGQLARPVLLPVC
jgi:hypothetical protein